MTVRDTSLAAYWQERTNLRFGNCQAKVIDSLHIDGPATRSELAARTGLTINNVCGRVRELLDAHLIHETTKVLDEHTGKYVWELAIMENV